MSEVGTIQSKSVPSPASNTLNEPNLVTRDSKQFNLRILPVQCKLTVGAVDDPLEHEADAMADIVMRMPQQNFIQRKCAHCEQAEKEEELHLKPLSSFIQRKESESGTIASETISNKIRSGKGNGSSIDNDTRSFMENRFGADFSNVKIHTGNEAIQMNRELTASAFTVGNDIYFNNGQYQPGSTEGKHLLAHELTHTIHQSGRIEKKIQRTGETGTSIYVDRLSTTNRNSAQPGIVSGEVERSEYINEQARRQGNFIHRAMVGIKFNENECRIYIPHKIQFVNHPAGQTTTCIDTEGGTADPVRPVSSTDFRRIANNYLRVNNDSLNGWFRLRLTNAPASHCNEQNIPIIVEVQEVTSNPDTTVIITGNTGRSYVSGDLQRSTTVLCNDPDEETLIHEAGHMTLGHGDEYSERSRRPAETERLTDFSRMAESGPSRLQLFHERHFNFVAEFIKGIYPDCNASLIYGDRSRYTPDVNLSVSLGGAGGEFSGLFFSAGAELGIPFDALRRTQILIGPRLNFLQSTDYRNNITALLYGVRLSFLGTFDSRIFNRQVPLGVGLHTEAGGGHNFGSTTQLPENFFYSETGASIGYRGNSFYLGVGGGIGVLNPNTPDALNYYRLGLEIGGRL